MKKILIVEDDQTLRNILEKKFGMEKYNIVTAADGDKALEIVFAEKPDLVLLDIMMPGLNGIAVLKQIRRDPWGKDLPIIIMSNLDYSIHAAEISPFKPSGYIMKAGSKLEDIIKTVEAALA